MTFPVSLALWVLPALATVSTWVAVLAWSWKESIKDETPGESLWAMFVVIAASAVTLLCWLLFGVLLYWKVM